MTEHNRDEGVRRRWDVLADEDHTYHLSEKRILLLQEQMVAPFQ